MINKVRMLVTLLCIVSVKSKNITADYCALKCGSKENTGCHCPLKETFADSPDCAKRRAKLIQISNKNKFFIVRLHNKIRDVVARQETIPSMFALAFDRDLEYLAECWAMRCQHGHDSCRRTSIFTAVHQNFFRTNEPLMKRVCSIDILADKAVTKWSHSYTKTEYRTMVRPEVQRIGCVAINYLHQDCRLLCNYAPVKEDIDNDTILDECPNRHKYYENLCLDANFDELGLENPTRNNISVLNPSTVGILNIALVIVTRTCQM